MIASDYWLIDIEVRGQWQPAGASAYERTRQAAQNRADVVHYWRPVRVTQAQTRECWERQPGRGWHPVDPTPSTPAPRSNPRAPLRTDAHAAPVPGPEGIPEDQLQWWQR